MDFNSIEDYVRSRATFEVFTEGLEPFRRVTLKQNHFSVEIYEDDFNDLSKEDRITYINHKIEYLTDCVNSIPTRKLYINSKFNTTASDIIHIIKSKDGETVKTYCNIDYLVKDIVKVRGLKAITCAECIAYKGSVVQ